MRRVSKGKRFSVNAKKLIAADGTNAHIAQTLGMNAERNYMGTAFCLSTYMSNVKTYNPSEWRGWWGSCYGSNFAPLMGTGPAGHFEDWADIIIPGNTKYRPEATFAYFTKKSPLAWMFENAKIEQRQGLSGKAFLPMKKPYKGNCLIIGDAAGFLEVQVQGALSCGTRAADAVANELVGKNGFEEYTKWWLDSFEFHKEGMLQVTQMYTLLVPYYTDDEIDYLFSLCDGITMDGSWSQYKSPKMIWATILQDPEKIKRERPEIWQKIEAQRTRTISENL
jgi:flavin-dependent dehydrogenase